MRSQFFLLLASAAALAAAPARADYLAEFRAYRAALEQGDRAAAVGHAETAWREADAALGDHKTTAVLAFNFAELVVLYTPDQAVEAYARAHALLDKVETGLVVEDVEAGAAYAGAASDPADAKARGLLKSALSARRAKGLKATPVSAYGWLLLCKEERSRIDALRYADAALADAEAMPELKDAVLNRMALIYAGAARVASKTPSPKLLNEAADYLDRAFPLFPPQQDIDSFDRLLALAYVWRSSAAALDASLDSSDEGPEKRRDFGGLAKRAEVDRVRWADAASRACPELKWKTIAPPPYPRDAIDDGVVGGALLGLDFSGTTVSRAVVLADIHDSGFGDAAVRASKDWVLETPLTGACASNRLLAVSYRIKQ